MRRCTIDYDYGFHVLPSLLLHLLSFTTLPALLNINMIKDLLICNMVFAVLQMKDPREDC